MIHLGLEVCDLKKTIEFYGQLLNGQVDFYNEPQKIAVLKVAGIELNFFETKDYRFAQSGKFHIGFLQKNAQVVDQLFVKAIALGAELLSKPYHRFDGDYTFFLRDPSGIPLEIFFGTHKLSRNNE